jgi:hypothetical protein
MKVTARLVHVQPGGARVIVIPDVILSVNREEKTLVRFQVIDGKIEKINYFPLRLRGTQ